MKKISCRKWHLKMLNFSKLPSNLNFSLMNFSKICKVAYFCSFYTTNRLKKLFTKKNFLMEKTLEKVDLLKFCNSFNFSALNFPQISKVTYFLAYYKPGR